MSKRYPYLRSAVDDIIAAVVKRAIIDDHHAFRNVKAGKDAARFLANLGLLPHGILDPRAQVCPCHACAEKRRQWNHSSSPASSLSSPG